MTWSARDQDSYDLRFYENRSDELEKELEEAEEDLDDSRAEVADLKTRLSLHEPEFDPEPPLVRTGPGRGYYSDITGYDFKSNELGFGGLYVAGAFFATACGFLIGMHWF